MSELALLGGPKAAPGPWPSWPEWGEADRQAVTNVIDKGKWWMYAYGTEELTSGGGTAELSQVEQAEREFAALHGVKHALAVTSGSMALECCMRAIDLQPGDEVITTPYTFFATSLCVLNQWALPVYVDIDPETYNIDPERIEAAITDRTRAIMPVHFAGELADMDAICAIAARHGLAVIEDAAQAHGVCLDGDRYACSFGLGGVLSFQESKCVTCGEGGMVLTNNDDFAEACWALRHCGRKRDGLWYEHDRLAWNSRMNELTAGLLRSQLARLADQNQRRMANVTHLYERLASVDGITPIKLHPRGTRRNHYLVMLRYEGSGFGGLSRARFIEAMSVEGIDISGGYAFPNFANPVFDTLDFTSSSSPFMAGRNAPMDYARSTETCPNAMRACRDEALWLNHHLFLGETNHVDMIVDAILKVQAHCAALK